MKPRSIQRKLLGVCARLLALAAIAAGAAWMMSGHATADAELAGIPVGAPRRPPAATTQRPEVPVEANPTTQQPPSTNRNAPPPSDSATTNVTPPPAPTGTNTPAPPADNTPPSSQQNLERAKNFAPAGTTNGSSKPETEAHPGPSPTPPGFPFGAPGGSYAPSTGGVSGPEGGFQYHN